MPYPDNPNPHMMGPSPSVQPRQPMVQPNWDRSQWGQPQPYNNWPNSQPNGYMQPMNQPQVPAPQPNNEPSFVGRFIQDYSDIRPNEVPMDGRAGMFPTMDLSSIYLKAWTSDGNIRTLRYVIDQNWVAPANAPMQNQQTDILRRLEAIEKSLQQSNQQRQNRDRNRNKEGDSNA